MAAEAQLKTAISVWFRYGEPIAILALANGAYDCYAALGAHAGRPSPFKGWLKTRSQGFQDRARDAINFIKHGPKKLTGSVPYMPILAEAMIMDSIESHQHLHGKQTHSMRLFVARWVLENPSDSNAIIRPIILGAVKVHDLADRNRTEFAEEGLKRLSASGS